MADLYTATKIAGSFAGGLTAYVFAQVELPDLGIAGNLGMIGALALVVGRYAFRQLEDYRKDLAAERARTATLNDRLTEAEQHIRRVTDYAFRLRLWATAAGAHADELPPPPPGFAGTAD